MTTSRHLIREARLRAGLTQAELGARAGKAHSAISRWERGEVEPSFETVRQLVSAAGFDLTVDFVPLAADPAIDRSMIRRLLALTPRQRLELAAAEANNLDHLLEASVAGI